MKLAMPPRVISPARGLAAAIAVATVACGGDPSSRRDTSAAARAADTRASAPGTVSAVQLASFADSAQAFAFRDALERDGWTAIVSPATIDGAARWRVQVQPTASAVLPHLIQAALRDSGREALVVTVPRPDSAPALEVEVLPVNRGSRGMIRTVRWLHSPDRAVLLAVEDPTAIENDPLPNGFLLASEEGPFVLQQDSVWDVAPSPDWEWLAFGRAYDLTGAGAEGITDAQWRELARATGLDLALLQAGSFPSSGMNIARGFARPGLVRIGPELTTTAAPSEPRLLPLAGGWRARWTTTGALAAFGLPPARGARDDSGSERWLLVDPVTGAVRDSLRSERALATLPWVQGPTIDVSIPFDDRSPRTLRAGDRTVESRQGWIRVRYAPAGGVETRRIVGPGTALATTATGRFILALVPEPQAGENEVPRQLVVYQVTY